MANPLPLYLLEDDVLVRAAKIRATFPGKEPGDTGDIVLELPDSGTVTRKFLAKFATVKDPIGMFYVEANNGVISLMDAKAFVDADIDAEDLADAEAEWARNQPAAQRAAAAAATETAQQDQAPAPKDVKRKPGAKGGAKGGQAA